MFEPRFISVICMVACLVGYGLAAAEAGKPGAESKKLIGSAVNAEKPFFEQMTTLPRRGIGPAIALLEDGRLFLAGTHGVFSSDHGKTWSDPVKLPWGGNIVVAKGRIVVLGHRVTRGEADGVVTACDIVLSASTDGGKTWTGPQKVPFPYKYPSGMTHTGIRLNDGTLFVGVSWDMTVERVGKAVQNDQDYKVGALLSRDEGKTWQFVGELHADYADNPKAISGVDEPSYVQLPDGQIYMLVRTGAGCLYETRSLDGGKTWSKATPTPIPVDDSPSAMCRLQTGEVVLIGQPAGLGKMCVWVSTDNCRTWSNRKPLVDPGAGWCGRYASVAQATDGTIVVVFRQYATPHGTGARRITGARFNRAWLMSTAEAVGQ